jgi:hypothetical protein
MARQAQSSRGALFLRMASCAVLLFSLWEYRHFRDYSVLVWPALGALFLALHGAVSARLVGNRVAVFAVVCALLAVPFWFAFGVRGLRQWAELREPDVVMDEIVPSITSWLREHAPSPGSRTEGTPAHGVMAPWRVGHHVNLLADRPVLVDPFNHFDVHEIVTSVFLAPDAATLDAALAAHGARYLVLIDTDRVTRDLLRRDPTLRRATPQAYRLHRDLGLSPEHAHFRPRLFVSPRRLPSAPHREPDSAAIPRGQVLERVPGATVHGLVNSRDGWFRVSCHVHVAGERLPRVWTTRLRATAGEISFATGLPAPTTETTFKVPGCYEVLGADGTELRACVPESAVTEGRTIEMVARPRSE